MQQLNSRLGRYGVPGLVGVLLIVLSIIPVQLTVAAYQAPRPQAILVLGGNPKRESVAAQVARYYPELEVWLSSGEMPKQAHAIFQTAGVSSDRLHLDYRATDTVTNFTTLVDDLKQHQIRHLYLVTSDFHMLRAKVIATLVLGSQGIAFTPIAVASNEPKESNYRIVRDAARSLLWIVTRQTGENFRGWLGAEKATPLIKNQNK